MPKGWRRYAPYGGHLDDQLVWDAMAKHGMTREEACVYVIASRNLAIGEAERHRREIQKRDLEATAKPQDQTTIDQKS